MTSIHLPKPDREGVWYNHQAGEGGNIGDIRAHDHMVTAMGMDQQGEPFRMNIPSSQAYRHGATLIAAALASQDRESVNYDEPKTLKPRTEGISRKGAGGTVRTTRQWKTMLRKPHTAPYPKPGEKGHLSTLLTERVEALQEVVRLREALKEVCGEVNREVSLHDDGHHPAAVRLGRRIEDQLDNILEGEKGEHRKG